MVATLSVTGIGGTAQAAGGDSVAITLTGEDVAAAAENVNGLTFKGFGVLSANSTSALLMDYKSQHPDKYWELIKTLFGGDHPIMNTVKIEMGNDRNTSTGPNAATMRTRDEYPNVQREPGFQLAADAKLVAAGDVHVSLLRWNRPAWVTSDADQYIWFKNTVLAVHREYGYMVDSLNPDSNETGNPNQALYKSFSGWLRGDTTGYQGATASDPNNGFASEDEKRLFRSIRTVAADTVGTPPVAFGNAMTATGDSSLRDAVDIVGFHYSSSDDSAGNMKRVAEQLDKEVWNSEGQATFSNSADRPANTNSDEQGGTGTQFGGTNSALEMGNWVTTGFSLSRRTLNIFQPAIGSFYDGFQYSSKELVSARDPWSGWLYYDGGLAVVQQFTQFATLGWENADNTAGIWRAVPQASGSALGGGNPPSGARAGNASYTTLAAPDASDFSTVIVNDSKFQKTYRITATNLMLGADATMEVWETRAADAGARYDAGYVHPVEEIQPDGDGTYSVTVAPWSTVTATTLDHAVSGQDGALSARPGYGNVVPSSPEYTGDEGGRDVLDTDASGHTNAVTDDDVLYADDFDYADLPATTTYDPATGALVDSGQSFLDSRGALAKPTGTPDVQDEDNGATPLYTNDTNGAFESVATSDPVHGRVLRQQIGAGMAGSAWNGGDPKTTLGDSRWANYTASVDVLFEEDSASYASIGAREQGGTANGQNVSAAELRVDPTGAWTFMRYGATVGSGAAAGTPGTDFTTGSHAWNTIAVSVAGEVYTALINGVAVASYIDPAPQATGRVQVGSGFTFTQFDNLRVETVDGYTPYYDQVIDGMHQASWDDTSAPVLQFDAHWNHVNGQGMYEWQRTASTSTTAGASLTYTFTGTGLDILGNNSGRATLDAVVDGERIVANAPTSAAGSERTTYMLRGLPNGSHTVVLSTTSADSLNVDAVGIVRAAADSAAVDTAALADAVHRTESLDPAEYTSGTWDLVRALLGGAQSAVADPVAYGLDAEGAAALITRLDAAVDQLTPVDSSSDVRDIGAIAVRTGTGIPSSLSFDGTEVPVKWNGNAAAQVGSAAVLATVPVTGITAQKTTAGVYQRFRATIVVVPDDLAYFIDSGSTASGDGSLYGAVRTSFPDLLNAVSDQRWDGTAPGSTWGYSTSASTIAAGSPLDWGSSYVGADYNRPVTYHLTLPAGTYQITAVQAPRPGCTTNIYATIRAGSTSTRQTATSTGAATPISQQISLDTQTVVDVEFGTNGTSGYNARLALVHVQRQPRDLGTVGALTPDQALPSTVAVDGADVPVTWNADTAAQQRRAYQKLTVTGTTTRDGTSSPVRASFEIIPERLVYYIDSGTGGAVSPQYAAVAAAVPGLLNDQVDQVSTASDQWGHIAGGMKTKASTDLTDKFSTGLYQDTTTLTYRLPLEAGTYTLTGGFTEWWGVTRTMYHTVNAGGEQLAKGTIALSGTSTPLTGDLTFALDHAATVEYVVTNEGAGGEKPVISWLAVAAHPDTSGLQAAVGAARGLSEADFTAGSWAPFAAALAAAGTVLADPGAADARIAQATTALTGAQSGLVSVVVLREAVTLAGTLSQEGFTTDSWVPFTQALAAAQAVLADGDAARQQIDAATADLLTAQQSLVGAPAPVDTTVLEAAVHLASGLVATDHTSGSWSSFASALAGAEGVLADTGTTQAAVDAATADLLNACGGLVSIAALVASVQASGVLAEGGYTSDTWEALAAALSGARAVLADGDATQEQVDAARDDLARALDQLEAAVSTTVLRALVDSASGLDAGDHTPESWSRFSDALDVARQVLADEEATQAQVDTVAQALVGARDALVRIDPTPEPGEVDRAALEAAIASAGALVESDFTPDSWAPFTQALATAQGVLADEEATQAQVDAATKTLITAQGALVSAQGEGGDGDGHGAGGTSSVGGGAGSGLSSTGADAGALGVFALLAAAAGAGVLIVRRRVCS